MLVLVSYIESSLIKSPVSKSSSKNVWPEGHKYKNVLKFIFLVRSAAKY